VKITELFATKEVSNTGLELVQLIGLKDMVIISGANGSGKSRLLRLLMQYNGSPTNVESENSRIRFETAGRSLNIIDVIPKSTSVADDRRHNRQDSQNYALQAENPGTGNLQTSTVSYIRRTVDRHFNASHSESEATDERRQEAKTRFEEFQYFIEQFLGTKIKRNLDGEPEIFGFAIADAQLSAGQAILLQLAVMLHAQSAHLDDVALILDEPENHLHPAACIDMISKIRAAAPKSQLWIATHSFGLIAEFADQATLLFAERGKIEYVGAAPERILRTLVGSEEGIDKVRDFISLPSVFAQNRYAAECLLPPSVVAGGVVDDQSKQISESIISLTSSKGALRILDWGAGKGRLLQNLVAMDAGLASKYDYRAFDPYPEDRETCESVIASVYGDAIDRYVSDQSTISVQIDPKSVDVVVMCNVLHEIEPADWLNLFGGDGPICSSLADNGFVLIVEDEEVPVGERAHKHGFIVFDTAELKALFKITKHDSTFRYSDQRDNGRLKAHLIPKACLTRITASGRTDAFKKRQQRASQEIKKIRNSDPTYRNGRKLGFWLQQYANSSLALEEFNGAK
jgi:ABC-type multidrug transport system ATPase subunit